MLLFYLSVIDDENHQRNFEYIYNTYYQKMLNVAYSVTGDQYDSEEALSSALFSISKNIGKIDISDEVKLKSFLYKVTKNAAIDILRAKKKTAGTVDIDTLFDIASDADVSKEVEGDERYRKIVEYILNMPSIYRDVLTLYYLHELSPKDIASALSREVNTVKSQINRGTKMLKEVLIKAGYNE